MIEYSTGVSLVSRLIVYFQIDSDRSDRRLNFYRQNTPITKYMDAAWRVKEQTENMN